MKFHDVPNKSLHFTPLSLMARAGHFDTYYVLLYYVDTKKGWDFFWKN